MKAHILLGLTVLTVLAAGCRHKVNPADPTDPVDSTGSENLLANPDFVTRNTSISDLDDVSARPWTTSSGSPQIAAGYGVDSERGFMQMWGNNSSSEAVSQVLSKPIVKGRTYSLSAYIKLMVEDPSRNLPYAYVDFYAINGPNYGQLHDDRPSAALIGTVDVRDMQWKKYSLGDWTADNNYTGFTIQVRSDGDAYERVSWAHIDGVELRRK